MGSDFTKFKRELFWEAVLNLCGEITHANGYNTQPFVSSDPRRSRSSSERHTLLVVHGDEEIVDVAVGGCMESLLTIEIYGYAMSKDTNPIRELNLLIQDVRNVIAENLGEIADFVEGGTALSFGILETDAGFLKQDGMAAFMLPLVFTYKAGPVW